MIERSTYNFTEVMLEFAKGKDLYECARAMNPGIEITDDVKFQRLLAQQRKLAAILINHLAKLVQDEMKEVASKLKAVKLDALIAIPTDYSYLRNLKIREKDMLDYPTLGMQLNFFINKKLQDFSTKLINLFKERKLNEEQKSVFESCQNDLLNFSKKIMPSRIEDYAQDSLVLLSAEGLESVTELMQERKELVNYIIAEYHLDTFKHINFAFEEFLKVTIKTFEDKKLDEDEQVHLGALTTVEYEKRKQSIPAEVTKVIHSLRKIDPVVTFSWENSIAFLDHSFINLSFISSHFEKGQQLYQTFEGLGLATSGYIEITNVLNQIKQPLIDKAIKRELVEKIEKYEDSLANYFQLAMRITMPLDQLIKYIEELLIELKAREAEVAMTTKPVDFSDQIRQNLIRDLESSTSGLKKCSDICKQKTFSINALKAIQEFIKLIDQELAKKESPLAFFQETKKRMRSALGEIRTFFVSVSGSGRTEQHTNFVYLQQNVNKILAENSVLDIVETKEGKSESLALLKKIKISLDTSAETFQQDIVVAPTP